MTFGERNGFKAHKEQQIADIDMSLCNRLYNWMVEMLRYLPDNSRILAYIIDKLGEANVSTERNTQIIAARFYHQIPQSEWYDPYDYNAVRQEDNSSERKPLEDGRKRFLENG